MKSLWRRQQQRQTTDKFQSEKLKKNLGTFKSNMISLLHDTSTCSTYMYMYTVWYNNTHTVLVWLWLTWLSPSLYCEYWSAIHNLVKQHTYSTCTIMTYMVVPQFVLWVLVSDTLGPTLEVNDGLIVPPRMKISIFVKFSSWQWKEQVSW